VFILVHKVDSISQVAVNMYWITVHRMYTLKFAIIGLSSSFCNCRLQYCMSIGRCTSCLVSRTSFGDSDYCVGADVKPCSINQSTLVILTLKDGARSAYVKCSCVICDFSPQNWICKLQMYMSSYCLYIILSLLFTS